MVSLIMACTMLTSTAYAVQETKAADGRPCVIDDARGPTTALQVQVLNAEVITLQCPCNAMAIPAAPAKELGTMRAQTKSPVAPDPAQNKPSPCAAGLLRPGWRCSNKSNIHYLSNKRESDHIQALQTGLSSGGPGLI